VSKLKSEVGFDGSINITCPECGNKQEIEWNHINFGCNNCKFVVANFEFDDFELNNIRETIRTFARKRSIAKNYRKKFINLAKGEENER